MGAAAMEDLRTDRQKLEEDLLVLREAAETIQDALADVHARIWALEGRLGAERTIVRVEWPPYWVPVTERPAQVDH